MKVSNIVRTAAVASRCKEDRKFSHFCFLSLTKFLRHDWGDTCEEDAKLNDERVKADGQILAVYKYGREEGTKIWIVADDNEPEGTKVVTILFPEDY